jgi:O-antigen/teichoic acid export membrane protein
MQQLFLSFNYTLAANVTVGAINFFTTIWFARNLGPDLMGQYAVVITLFHLITAFMVPGFNQAIIRDPSRSDLNAAASVATAMQTLMVLITSGVAWSFYYWHASEPAVQILVPGAMIVAGMMLSFFSYLYAAPIEADMNYKVLSYLRLGSIIASSATGLLVSKAGFGIYGLAVRDLMASAFMLAGTLHRSRLTLRWSCTKKAFKDLTRFSGGIWLLNLTERVMLRLDYAFIVLMFSNEVVGIYFALRSAVDGLLGFILSPIQTVLFSFLCRSQNAGSYWNAMLNSGFSLMALIAVSGTTVTQLIGPRAINMIWGDIYESGHVILPGLFIYCVATMWFESVKVYAMAQNAHRFMIIPRIVQIALSLVCIYPLTMLMGLRGAGITTGLAALALASVSTYQMKTILQRETSQSLKSQPMAT